MANITISVPEEVKEEAKHFSWINLSEIARLELLIKEILLSKLESKEEKELIRWSVELGRKAKKGRFKKLLAELSSRERKELLK